jgi:hypothetical protein
MVRVFAIGTLLVALLAGGSFGPSAGLAVAQAQSQQQVQPAKPLTRLQKIGAKTKQTWAQMKARWVLHHDRWLECRAKARSQRLAGRKTRKFLESCMGG